MLDKEDEDGPAESEEEKNDLTDDESMTTDEDVPVKKQKTNSVQWVPLPTVKWFMFLMKTRWYEENNEFVQDITLCIARLKQSKDAGRKHYSIILQNARVVVPKEAIILWSSQ